MRSRNLKYNTKQALVFSFLLVFVASGIIGLLPPKKAKAAYNDLPTYLNDVYDQYISLEPNDPDTGRGNYTPSFRFILYSPVGNTSSTVQILNVSTSNKPSCSDFSISKAAIDRDNLDSGRTSTVSPATVSDPAHCSPTSNGFIITHLDRWGVSQRFNNNYMGTVVRLALKDGKSSLFTDVQVRGSDDRLSYFGDNSPPSEIPASANGVSMSIPQGAGSTIVQKFAPPCNYNGDRAYIWWKDADSRRDPNSGNPVRFEVREFRNGYNNGYRTIDSGDAGNGGQHYRSSFIPRDRAKYEIRFTGVQSRTGSLSANTIKVWSPFDSAAAFVDCPQPPPPNPCEENWTHNLGNNSVYKFSFFDRAPNITPPSDTNISINTGRSWATTSGAKVLKDPEYQNSEDDNSYSTNKPNEMQYLGGYVLIERWEDYDNDSDPALDRRRYTNGLSQQAKCATAACTDIRITNKLEGTNNGVPAGQNFEVEVDITGTNLPGYLASQPLAVIVDSADWGGGVYNIEHGIGSINFPDTTDTKNFSLNMPYDLTARNLSVYIGYPGLYAGKVSASCGVPVNPYQEFHITPIAQTPDMDDEDPRVINYTTGGNNSGASVSLGWERQLLRKRGGSESTLDGVYNSANTFGNHTENHSIGSAGVSLVPGTLLAGDQVCSRASFSVTDGWVGPGNHIAQGSAKSPPANPIESCVTISDRPYLRLYGSDVIAGSDFAIGGACNKTNSSQIKTFFSRNADRSGSGGQFAALALGAIDQFSSASLRTALPTPRNGLSFANNGTTPGSYDGAAICSSDFFGETQYDDPAKKDTRQGATLPLSSIDHPNRNDEQTLAEPNNPQDRVTINGTTGFGIRHTIFVDGDLSIDSNIEYSAFTNPSDAPALAVVVRGNIYIDKGVNRLDGMYVAQKKADGTGGTIYTCSDGFTPYNTGNDAALLANCSSQLTINGAFVADYVRFLRTINSLRDSLVNDQELAGITKAAEIFNFTPEIYLSPPPFNNENTSSSGKYKYFDTLPPIL